MALILKRNGAPLSGALFVTNPRRRRRKLKMNRAKRRSLKFRTLGGLFAKANGRKRRRLKRNRTAAMMNPRRRSAMSKVRRFVAKMKRRMGLRRNAGYLLNRKRRRSSKKRGLLAFLRNRRHKRNAGYELNPRRRRKHSRKHRRNAGYLLNRRRRSMRRNPGYQLGVLAPVQRLAGKFPVVGPVVASSLGALAFGGAALATHYYGMKAVRWAAAKLPVQVQAVGKYVAPVGYSLLGITASVALQKLPIPTVGPITPEVRKTLGQAAIVVGAAIDLWRWFHNSSQDLGDLDGDDYGDDYGDGQAYDVVPLSGIGEGYGAIGEGYGNVSDYADAEMADAYYSGPDLNISEGQAALAGPDSFRARFGPPPKIAARRASMLSRHAGREGHRWGWIIKLVGFENFQRIAAMPPEERCALINSLKQQALATVQAQIAQAKQSSMAGIGMAGIGLSGIAEGLSGIGESGMADYGVMMAGSAY